MQKIIRISRFFYATALFVYGVQQFIYGDFRPVFFPAWQSRLPGLIIWTYIFGLWLIYTGAAIIFEKKARTISLLLGATFLLLFCLVHVPFEIISDPYSKHPGSWTNALKELALSGGAFVIAGTFPGEADVKKRPVIALLEKIIPLGRILFSVTLVSFGIDHFLYINLVAKLVPAWFPDPVFWTYLGGVTLICSGVAIILDIRMKQIAILLGIVLFLWVVTLHIPRAIATPTADRGNELSSVFDALAFCGTAFLIALTVRTKNNELA